MVTYTKDKEGRVVAAHSHAPIVVRRQRAKRKVDPTKQTPLQKLESLFN